MISLEGKARAGKTDKDLRDHGWFVFFAPAKNPEVAGMIFAEHAEHGYLGAPIAKHMINTYFLKKEGKPLPEYPKSGRAGRAAAGPSSRRRRLPPRLRPPCAPGQVGNDRV